MRITTSKLKVCLGNRYSPRPESLRKTMDSTFLFPQQPEKAETPPGSTVESCCVASVTSTVDTQTELTVAPGKPLTEKEAHISSLDTNRWTKDLKCFNCCLHVIHDPDCTHCLVARAAPDITHPYRYPVMTLILRNGNLDGGVHVTTCT